MGARATVMVAGTTAAVGVALSNARRLTPAFVEASPAPRPSLVAFGDGAATMALPDPRAFLARWFALATLLAAAGIAVIALMAAMVSFGVQRASSEAARPAFPMLGPSSELRPSASLGAGYEVAYSAAYPSADTVGGALLAAAEERKAQEVAAALTELYEQRQQQVAAAAVAPRNTVRSMNAASGYAVGTLLRARITIYGCVGPGGGFCNNTASGVPVYEGAAACSADLPFGTRIRIIGDPTGRTYECLDRGALASTWIDVFFYNTADGIAWQSLLGGTVTDIEIVN